MRIHLKNIWLNIQRYPKLSTLLIVSPYIIIQTIGGGFFKLVLAAAIEMREGNNPFLKYLTYQGKVIDWTYGYSPFSAFVAIPFTFFPAEIPALILLISGVFMLFRIFEIISLLLNIPNTNKKYWWICLTLLFSLRFILHNYEMVQFNLLLLYLSIEGMYQIFYSGKTILGSALFALGMNLKLLPVVFLPYLIYRAKWKALSWTLIISILLLLAPGIYTGFDLNMEMHQDWIKTINPFLEKYNTEQNTREFRIQGISALIPAYFLVQTNSFFQVVIYPLSKESAEAIIQVLRWSLIIFTIYVLQTKPFKSSETKFQFLYEVSYLLMITPLIFPQQNKWAFVSLIPAFAVIFYITIYHLQRKLWISICMALVLILTSGTTDGIVGKYLYDYVESMKLLTIGTLILLPIFIYVRQKLNAQI